MENPNNSAYEGTPSQKSPLNEPLNVGHPIEPPYPNGTSPDKSPFQDGKPLNG